MTRRWKSWVNNNRGDTVLLVDGLKNAEECEAKLVGCVLKLKFRWHGVAGKGEEGGRYNKDFVN